MGITDMDFNCMVLMGFNFSKIESKEKLFFLFDISVSKIILLKTKFNILPMIKKLLDKRKYICLFLI